MMQIVRFFEDREGRRGDRRLLVGVATYDESWEIDGGRREAVRLAVETDTVTFAPAYQAYKATFEAQEDAAPPAPDQTG